MKIFNKIILAIYMIFPIIFCHANDMGITVTNNASKPSHPMKCKDDRKFDELRPINFLPDPFHFSDGKRVTKDDWNCRQQEIASQLETFSLGVKESAPDKTTATLEGNLLKINIEHQDKTTEFVAEITWPTKGKTPYPAIIGIGGSIGMADPGLRHGPRVPLPEIEACTRSGRS